MSAVAKTDWANLPVEDVAMLTACAYALVAAHERRSKMSKHATLSEADAIFHLRYAFMRIEAKS